MNKQLKENWIILLITAVQFVNILDFMMVMPLGPDFAKDLHIEMSNLGIIGGSYTASAAISGLLGSFFLDKFDRKKALFLAMIGLSFGTIGGAFADSYLTLILARVVAGAFGGPATSLSLSIVADTIPPERRGRAMGAVMGSFSLASIFGVPIGLEMARIGTWHLPFIAVGATGFLIATLIFVVLPPMTKHLHTHLNKVQTEVSSHFFRKEVWLTLVMMSLGMLGPFMMIPNFSSFFQFNLNFPREKLGLLYFLGGITSLISMRIAGKLVDQFNAYSVSVFASVILILVLYFGYVVNPTPLIPGIIFVGFMMSMSIRGVPLNSLGSRVPFPQERAKFMSILSAVQHISSAAGAFLSTQLLTSDASGKLVGMPTVAYSCMLMAALVPTMVRAVEKRVKQIEKKN